jgi:hypothetical protein
LTARSKPKPDGFFFTGRNIMTTAKTIEDGAVFVTPDFVEEIDRQEGEGSQSCRRNLRNKFKRVHHDESSPFSEAHHQRETRVRQRTLLNDMVSGETGWEEGRIINNEIFHTRVAYAREMVIDEDISIAALQGFAKEVEQAHMVRNNVSVQHSALRRLQRVYCFALTTHHLTTYQHLGAAI